VQTDGSSVVLPGIATLNDGKVDLMADPAVSWFVDYNHENCSPETGLPCGTLRIPAFLAHNNELVCSRSLLRRACERFSLEMKNLLAANPALCTQWQIAPEDVDEVVLTAATELEFWVRTPEREINREQLSVSQGLKEQYWKRTKGVVRTALEHSIDLLELYGFKPEMGHKEVGGVKAQLTGSGSLDHIMEQLEIDWRFSPAMQAADNELFARIFIKEAFRLHGLEASFLAKPIEGVAGSGEHVHVNAVAIMKNGRRINLFAPADFNKDFLSEIGWGALMGFMKHYDVISPFITVSNDAFSRLKPGFEAPTHAVASLGCDIATPSRNRTVLVGLIRHSDQPLATRFEIRSPNPHTNTFISLAAIYQCMLDGIRHAVRSGRLAADLEKEFCKSAGEPGVYLRTERMYRSEDDVFAKYSEEERDRLFGKPPAGVYDTLRRLLHQDDGLAVLCQGEVFSDAILSSYSRAMLDVWEMELRDRILHDNLERVRICTRVHNHSDYDESLWGEISALRQRLARDTNDRVCLFNEIRQALDTKNLRLAAALQMEMDDMLHRLEHLYACYLRNQLDE
ncbi:MAG TPA: glutamine synthetase, partial [Clostridiales bacterium]|nr:glutamine synthetase [Clostridiales bacterium]